MMMMMMMKIKNDIKIYNGNSIQVSNR